MKISKVHYFFKPAQHLFTGMLALNLVFVSVIATNAQDEQEFEPEEEFSQTKKSANDPVALFNMGQDSHAKGDLKLALKHYSDALKINAEFPEAEYQRGIVYKELGRLIEAEKSFRRTISLKNRWPLPHVQLGLLYLSEKRFGDAELSLREAIRLDKGSIVSYVALTDVLVRSRAPDPKLVSMLSVLEKISSAGSVPVELLNSRAIVERELGDISAAYQSLERALSIDRNNPVARSQKIELLLAGNKNKAALAEARDFAAADAKSDNAKYLLARALHANNRSADASNILDSIETPSSEMKQFRAAINTVGSLNIDALEQMLTSEGENVYVLGRLCSLTRATNPKKALYYCKRALVLEKSNIDYAIGYGAALVQLKQFPAAAAVLRNLLKHSPESYPIHANLATALFQMKDYQSAKAEYQWIVKRKPDLAIGYYFLGITHDRLQEYSDAMVIYRKFLTIADIEANKLEIEKVNLRIPPLKRLIEKGMGRKKKKRSSK